MAMPKSNKLLPIIAGIVIVMLVVVGIKSIGKKSADVSLKDIPTTPGADQDSPVETIKTLTAAYKEVKETQETFKDANEQLKAQNDELAKKNQLLAERLAKQEKTSDGQQDLISRLSEKMGHITDKIPFGGGKKEEGAATNRKTEATAQTARGNDIPVGLGYDEVGGASDTIVWVKAVDSPDVTNDKPSGPFGRSNQPNANGGAAAGRPIPVKAKSTSTDATTVKADEKIPIYTIPENATLIGSTAFTAIIGRVPKKGNVQDPYPFKVLVGADNLAANGIDIPPGLFGTVWSGTAFGDYTLACARGKLDSVTFVFEDGTVRTVNLDNLDTKGGSKTKPLGEISDDNGVPCISGELITNAGTVLGERVAVAGVGAAGAAAAAKETTTVLTPAGGVNQAVTGDFGSYLIGHWAEGSAKETLDWLKERQDQMFDAIFVKPGVKLAIHVEQEIRIDYDPKGRKVLHEAKLPSSTNAVRAAGLD